MTKKLLLNTELNKITRIKTFFPELLYILSPQALCLCVVLSLADEYSKRRRWRITKSEPWQNNRCALFAKCETATLRFSIQRWKETQLKPENLCWHRRDRGVRNFDIWNMKINFYNEEIYLSLNFLTMRQNQNFGRSLSLEVARPKSYSYSLQKTSPSLHLVSTCDIEKTWPFSTRRFPPLIITYHIENTWSFSTRHVYATKSCCYLSTEDT